MSTPASQFNISSTYRQKAAIRRASARARREANRLDERALTQLDELYRRASIELQQAIFSYAGDDGNLRLQVLTDLQRQTDAIINRLAQARNTMLDGQLLDAATIAVQPWAEVAPAVLVNVPQQAVNFVRAYIDPDDPLKLNLSARLWRVDSGARQLVGSAIEQAVIQGHGASQAANDFLSRGEPVPAGLKLQADQANAVRAGRLAGDALLNGENNPRANAMRVFRTELNRAHGEAYMMGGEDVPDFGGWRFLLSARHPAVDICDMHANANLYGLGPGVYPDRARCPWQAHPNTLSYTEIVFASEITDDDRAGKESRLDYLNKQSQAKQDAILNSRKKGAALREGILRENQIATPWNVLKPRYIRQGVDVDALGGTVTDVAPRVTQIGARGVPVSNALEPMAYRTISNDVLGAIDRVHGDGNLPTIPIISQRGITGYASIKSSGRPVRIQISPDMPVKHVAIAHEVGHFIDHHGIRSGHFSSVESKLFEPWRVVVRNSKAVSALHQAAKNPIVTNSVAAEEITNYINNYLLTTDELWARSYAQYIGVKSGNRGLLADLDIIRKGDANSPVHIPTQWDDDDFEPIAEAIDGIFARLGWSNG